MKKMNPLTGEEEKIYSEAVKAFSDFQKTRENIAKAEAEAEKERKIQSGEYIEINGKIFDKRFYEG